ncbi:N-acetyltransferase GCN5 [Moraxella macacae 0408225]|uniref:N-acetyltransferase GCN5 n=1 Tax=Moraxella macacae 0408225 TaxID=1230338 RepID=L2F7C2_9GAMM|nr:GNAT family N-acetyltransferase [Moraxella macacae]ELA08932.1 N-acetyltransferase GCN5 [Moraxella macacae 0408225]
MFCFEPRIYQGVLYRLAKPQDLPELVDIYNESIVTKQSTAVLEPLTVSDLQDWFVEHHENANRPMIVAVCQQSDRVLGYGCFSDLYPRPAYHISAEISVYVANDAKGRGIGRYFVQLLQHIAPACGVAQMVAKIFAHNQPSLNLFEKQGFSQWGYLPKVCDMGDFIADVVILGQEVFNTDT